MSTALHPHTQKVAYGQGYFGMLQQEKINAFLADLCEAEKCLVTDDDEIEICVPKLQESITALNNRENWAVNIVRSHFKDSISDLFKNTDECVKYVITTLLDIYEQADKKDDFINLTWF